MGTLRKVEGRVKISIRNVRMLIGVLFVVEFALNCIVAYAETQRNANQSSLEATRALSATLAFEHKLSAAKDDNARRKLIHTYYGGLRSSPEKQLGIALISDRYVSPIPVEMRAEVLTPLLKDRDPDIRRSTVRALGFVANSRDGDSAKVAKRLASMLKTDPPLRSDILMAIGLSHRKEYAQTVSQFLVDSSPSIRAQAAFSVALLTAPETTYQLQIAALLDDPDRNVRQRAISALYNMNAKSAEHYLEKMLGDADPLLRIDVLRMLEYSHAIQASAAIERLRNDTDERVRKEVEEAIKQLSNANER